MAIQVRRGNAKDLDPSKLLPGEWAAVLDNQSAYLCYGNGVVKQIATYEDFEKENAIIADYTQKAQTASTQASAAANVASGAQAEASKSATNAKNSETAAASSANQAALTVSTVLEKAAQAEVAADRAVENANNSSVSAQEAAASENNALNYLNQSVSYSEQAGESALEALQSMEFANQSAQNAQLSESNASTYAGQSNVSANNSQNSAVLSESFAKGGTGSRAGEDTDNSEYYADLSRQYMEEAQAIVGIGIATVDIAGLVKPDGVTITIDEDGTIRSVGQGTIDYNELQNRPSIGGVVLTGNKSLSDLGYTEMTEARFNEIWNTVF